MAAPESSNPRALDTSDASDATSAEFTADEFPQFMDDIAAISPQALTQDSPSNQTDDEDSREKDSDESAPVGHPAHGPGAHPKQYNYNGTIIATIDPDRLLQVKPTHGRTRHKGEDAEFSKEDERLRFDSAEDWASLSDRLAIPSDGDVQISFEVEFDPQENADMPAGDITVFWGAGGEGNNRRQGNSHSWTGYELKLGSPNRETLAYKFEGHDIEREHGNELFTPGQAHEVKSPRTGAYGVAR